MYAHHPKQVDAQRAYRRKYLTLIRSITHWHQANEVARATPAGGTVLEIGPGSGHTTWLLEKWGYTVVTLDFDPKIAPDITGDITKLPIADRAFDCVIAAEVLEHIPFSEFGTALRELKRIARKSVIVTLPAPFAGLACLINLPVLNAFSIYLGLPYWRTHKFDGEHHWELGKRGYELGRVLEKIEKSGLKVVRRFRPGPSRYCYFISMEP